jgi:hypothetical protein
LGSHGCSFTASATFQVPRSITQSAAQPRRKPHFDQADQGALAVLVN